MESRMGTFVVPCPKTCDLRSAASALTTGGDLAHRPLACGIRFSRSHQEDLGIPRRRPGSRKDPLLRARPKTLAGANRFSPFGMGPSKKHVGRA